MAKNKTAPAKKLYLIDGSAYIFRAFHAIRELRTSKGFPTNAVFGFVTMIRKIIREHRPDYLALVFDPPGPTFRDEMYEEYKANRPDMPDELEVQIPYIFKVVDAFRIPSITREGYEADDIIATLARKMDGPGIDTVIVTGDKDMMQVVSDRIRLYDPMKDKYSGPDEVRERFGVGPEKVIEILGLAGDSVDNISGVPGIGEKTAKELIQKYGSIEGVLKHLDEISGPKRKQALSEHADQAKLSRKLATLVEKVPVPVSLSDLAPQDPDQAALSELFRELEFSKFARELAPEKTVSPEHYRTIFKEKDLLVILAELKKSSRFAIDLETVNPHSKGINPIGAEIVGISLCGRENDAVYIPVAHRYLGAPRQLDREEVLKKLRSILEDPTQKKCGQNIKYDYLVLKNYGITLAGISFDPMVASYLINPGKPSHSLSELSLEYLGHTPTSYKEVTVTNEKKKQLDFDEVEIERATAYSGEDAHLAYLLSGLLEHTLADLKLDRLFSELELPLIPVLAEMEWAGVKVDRELLSTLSREFERTLSKQEQEIYRAAGTEFNINSPKQLAEILFHRLKLPVIKKTKTGYSTDVEVLTQLAEHHPLPKNLLTYRIFFKLKTTYIDALPELIHPHTGRIHASFNQTVTATGRLSSSDPNLQNIPIRTEEGRKIRRAFIAEKGHILISADYSQIELRVLAHLSRDPLLLDSFRRGEDVHQRTAEEVFGKSSESFDELRRRAKVINFGIIYGMSAYGLSRELGIDPKTAQEYIDGYFKRYQGVRKFLDKVLRQAKKDKYVMTLWGRKRSLPELESSNRNIQAFGERIAVNTPIQGSAADLIKAAMITISRKLKEKKLSTRMIIQVHDELVFEAPEKEVERVKDLVRGEMEGVIDLEIPLLVEVNSGLNWDEAH